MVDTILVADDENDVRNLVKIILEKNGYNVIEASNGQEAEEKIISELPDLALLDIVMPIKGGFDVCRSIKNNKKTLFVPVVMFSVLGRPVDKKMSKDAGADSHLTKPFTAGQLMTEIDTVIKDSKKTRFSRAVGFEQSQISKKVFLYEYDSSTNYEKSVRDYILEAKMNNENPVIITREQSAVQENIKDEQSITLIPFKLPLDISQIIKQPNKQCLVFDNLTDMILSTNFQETYNFTRDSIARLNSEGLSALFLLNPDSHGYQEVHGIRNLFNNKLRALTLNQEQSLGLEQDEIADVQAVFFMDKDSFVSHEEFDIVLELFNPGRGSLSLIKIERIVPLSFRITHVSNIYGYKENVLDFRGKRLKPLSSIEVAIGVIVSERGMYTINPKIVFIDGNGIYKEVEVEPISITVNDVQSVLEKMLNIRQSFEQEKKDNSNDSLNKNNI